jgi:hypothetical protein
MIATAACMQLTATKKRYDPSSLLRLNANIKPAA